MKFSKSGILTLSGMLLANSFLLLATAYATENTKQIKNDPANARQNIKEIILSNGAEKNICTIILFDISGSMFPEGQRNPPEPGQKRNNAVEGTIEYSQLLLDQYSGAKVGLILFGDKAKYTHHLDTERFTTDNFPVPKKSEGTRTDFGIEEGIKAFSQKDATGCTIKNIIIISDGEPGGYSAKDQLYLNEKAINGTYQQTLSGKEAGINFYSIGYGVGATGEKILRGVSAGGFYNSENTTIAQIFKNMQEDNKGSSIKLENEKLKINTYNFIISTGGDTHYTNLISNNSKRSNILGGKGNRISAGASFSSIIAGNSNSIQTSDGSSILGGSENEIMNGDLPEAAGLGGNSTIIGGYKNKIEGSYSTIGGGKLNRIKKGNYSIIIGNNSKISGDNSVSMGIDTTISGGNNSFYWSDGQKSPLTESNVFSVVSSNGMVINTSSPNQEAQLTISGNLMIRPNKNDENIECGKGKGKGIIKSVKKSDGNECLCNCNGETRKSLYNGVCEGLCADKNPVCGETVTFKDDTYNGTCDAGKVINTSYFVTTNNTVHRTCQGNDGSIAYCTGTIK